MANENLKGEKSVKFKDIQTNFGSSLGSYLLENVTLWYLMATVWPRDEKGMCLIASCGCLNFNRSPINQLMRPPNWRVRPKHHRQRRHLAARVLAGRMSRWAHLPRPPAAIILTFLKLSKDQTQIQDHIFIMRCASKNVLQTACTALRCANNHFHYYITTSCKNYLLEFVTYMPIGATTRMENWNIRSVCPKIMKINHSRLEEVITRAFVYILFSKR
jgi:hypothetical protein